MKDSDIKTCNRERETEDKWIWREEGEGDK